MKNEVVVVELWVNSWLFVVDVVLEHVVDELIQWVSLFVKWWWELLLLKICESLVNCWILMNWCFILKFYASLSVFSCIRPVNIIWNEFWVLERSKLGFLGKKGLKPEGFFSELISVRLSEPSTNSKRACPVGSGHSSLERAVSELQAKGDQKLLEPGHSREPDFA